MVPDGVGEGSEAGVAPSRLSWPSILPTPCLRLWGGRFIGTGGPVELLFPITDFQRGSFRFPPSRHILWARESKLWPVEEGVVLFDLVVGL